MADYPYPALVAYDPVAGALAKGAVGQVFALSDLATPLEVRDLSGIPMSDLESSADGVLPAFVATDHAIVVWISGSYTVELESTKGIQEAAERAAVAAEASAQAAADAVSTAVTDSAVAAIVTTPDSATATAIKAIAGSPVLVLEAGEDVPPETPAGTLVVRLADPGPTVYAADAFERALAAGWGSADLGGAWTLSEANAFRVESGAGVWNASAAVTRAGWLQGVSQQDAEVEALLTTSAIDHAQLIRVHLRRNNSDAGYQAALYIRADTPGGVAMKLDANGAEIQGYSADMITDYTPGMLIRVRMRVTTTAPGQTTVQARAWKDGTTEPTIWHRSVVDSTPSLQVAGFPGISGYTGGQTATPVEIKVHDFKVIEAV